MTTPLLLLLLLIGPWCIQSLRTRRVAQPVDADNAGRVGLLLAFLFTASGHFLMTDVMALMLPPWAPARVELVLATGVLEIAIALGLLWQRTRAWAAWAAMAVLIGFYPVNVYAAWQQVPMGGHAWGLDYMWLRTPLQILLVAWTWRFGLGRPLPTRRR